MNRNPKMKQILLSSIIATAFSLTVFAQDDMMKILEEESEKNKKPDYATATFKTTRIINGHSVENVAAGVLDLRISHRFGYISGGAYQLWGLDQATMRIGLDYGLTKRWMIGVGRSTYQKQFDGFSKFKILRQSSGTRNIPVTISAAGSVMYKSINFEDPTRINYLASNLFYSGQLLIGRKFSESLSLQVMPTMIHYNLVPGATDPNDVFAVGAGGRIKLSKRISLNAEYYYQLPGYKLPGTYNSLAVGVDIETGGHVFQLNFTNSTGMTERSFISETTGNFFKGDIHFGFTISRVFTIVKPKEFVK
jgi:opacity protein-like surface antigen